jgi:hypothetical protein
MKSIQSGVLLVTVLICWQEISFADIRWNWEGEVAEIYDDNVTFSKTDKISDEITKLSLMGGFTQESKTSRVELNARLTGNIFAEHPTFNYLSQDITLDAVKELSPYDQISAHEKFNHSEDPVSFENAFGRTNGRYSLYSNNLALEYARQMSQKLTTRLRYTQINNIFTRESLNDSMGFSPELITEYTIDSATITSLGYKYTYWDFESGSDANIHTLYGGLRRFLTRQLYLDIKPGVNFINSFDGRNISKPRFEVGLTDDVDENTSLNLTYIKEYSVTPYFQEIFDNWRLIASAAKELNARLKLTLSAFYGKGRYIGSGISDRLSGANIGLEYALTKRTSVYCKYTYQRSNSNTDTHSYTRNMAMLGIRVAF